MTYNVFGGMLNLTQLDLKLDVVNLYHLSYWRDCLGFIAVVYSVRCIGGHW